MKGLERVTMHEISATIVLRRLFAMAFLAVLVLFAPSLARKAMCTSSRELAEKFPLKRWFIELNGGTCRLAGRRLCNGVCRTSDGMLFSELKGRWGMHAIENNVVRFAGWLAARDIVYIYVQIPAKIDMAGSMLPTGFVHRGFPFHGRNEPPGSRSTTLCPWRNGSGVCEFVQA